MKRRLFVSTALTTLVAGCSGQSTTETQAKRDQEKTAVVTTQSSRDTESYCERKTRNDLSVTNEALYRYDEIYGRLQPGERLGIYIIGDEINTNGYPFLYLNGELHSDSVYDAITAYREARKTFEEVISEYDVLIEYTERCQPDHPTYLKRNCHQGQETAKLFGDAATMLLEASKLYIDEDAESADDVAKAQQLKRKAIKRVVSGANTMPDTPTTVENRVKVYSPDGDD